MTEQIINQLCTMHKCYKVTFSHFCYTGFPQILSLSLVFGGWGWFMKSFWMEKCSFIFYGQPGLVGARLSVNVWGVYVCELLLKHFSCVYSVPDLLVQADALTCGIALRDSCDANSLWLERRKAVSALKACVDTLQWEYSTGQFKHQWKREAGNYHIQTPRADL